MKRDSHVFPINTEGIISMVRASFMTCEPWGRTEMLKWNRWDDGQKQTTFNITVGPLYLSFLTTLELQSRQTDMQAYSRWWGEALFPPIPRPLESSVSLDSIRDGRLRHFTSIKSSRATLKCSRHVLPAYDCVVTHNSSRRMLRPIHTPTPN